MLSNNHEVDLEQHLRELKFLDRDQFNYVYERSKVYSVQAALKAINRSKGWYNNLPEARRIYLEELANRLNLNRKLLAEFLLRDAVVRAAEVKIAGLEIPRERQQASTEILNRILGSPVQRQETNLSGGLTLSWADFVKESFNGHPDSSSNSQQPGTVLGDVPEDPGQK